MLYVRPAEIEKLASQQQIDVLNAFLQALDDEDLAKELGDQNMVVINQSEMAFELEMHRPNVARSIKKLIEAGFLLPGPKAGHYRIYQINRHVAWRDNEKNWAWAHEEHYKRQMRAANPTEHRKKRMKAARITGVVTNPTPDPDSNPEPK